MFEKGTTILNRLANSFRQITTANGCSITINKVLIYSLIEYANLDVSKLPAILILAAEDFEQSTNIEYEGTLSIELYVAYQKTNIDSDTMDVFSKLKKEIFKKIDYDITQGLSYVINTTINRIGHPLESGVENIYEFRINLTIEYYFNSQEP